MPEKAPSQDKLLILARASAFDSQGYMRELLSLHGVGAEAKTTQCLDEKHTLLTKREIKAVSDAREILRNALKRDAYEKTEREAREVTETKEMQSLLSTKHTRQKGIKPMQVSDAAMEILLVIRTIDLKKVDPQETEASRALRLQGGWRAHEANHRNYCIMGHLIEAMIESSGPITQAKLAELTGYPTLEISYGMIHVKRHARRAGYTIGGDDESGWSMISRADEEKAVVASTTARVNALLSNPTKSVGPLKEVTVSDATLQILAEIMAQNKKGVNHDRVGPQFRKEYTILGLLAEKAMHPSGTPLTKETLADLTGYSCKGVVTGVGEAKFMLLNTRFRIIGKSTVGWRLAS